MRPYRCQICGETYLGEIVPDRCPFCGAAGKHLLRAAEWVPYGKVQLSEESYKDCERALQLELDNMAFYRCAAGKSKNQILQAIFKRLSKQELEHAELICEMMGIELPEAPAVSCSDKDHDNMEEAHARENRAIHFYQEVANRAPEQRMQQVFRALMEIESEHLIVSNTYK